MTQLRCPSHAMVYILKLTMREALRDVRKFIDVQWACMQTRTQFRNYHCFPCEKNFSPRVTTSTLSNYLSQ